MEVIDLHHNQFEKFGKMEPAKVKTKLTEFGTKLNLIVSRYERSGNGEGSRTIVEDDEFEHDNKVLLKW